MIYLILIAALLVRLNGLSQSFWLDETAQAIISHLPLNKINFSVDFQPPLFYIFTHYWQKLTINQEWFLRLPSVFFGVLTIWVLYRFTKKILNHNAAMVSSLLLATSSYHIYFSQEYRMYSLFTLFTLLSWVYLLEKKYYRYLFILILMLYTHYFAFIVCLSQLVYVFFWQSDSLKKYLKIILISGLFYLPWLPTLITQLNHAQYLINLWPVCGQLSGVDFARFPGLFFAKLTVGMISPQDKLIYLLAVGVNCGIFLLAVFNIILSELDISLSESAIANTIKKSQSLGVIIAGFFIPLILLWFSSFFTNINSVHRLVFLAPLFYLILASSYYFIAKSENKLFYSVASFLLIYLIVQNHFFSYNYLFLEKYHREDWKSAVLYSDDELNNKQSIVITAYNLPWPPMQWYSKRINNYIGGGTSMKITPQTINQNILNYNHIIYYSYLFEISDPNRHIEEYLIQNNYYLSQEKNFRGVGIIKIYSKISF